MAIRQDWSEYHPSPDRESAEPIQAKRFDPDNMAGRTGLIENPYGEMADVRICFDLQIHGLKPSDMRRMERKMEAHGERFRWNS